MRPTLAITAIVTALGCAALPWAPAHATEPDATAASGSAAEDTREALETVGGAAKEVGKGVWSGMKEIGKGFKKGFEELEEGGNEHGAPAPESQQEIGERP